MSSRSSSPETRRKVFERDGSRCRYCGKEATTLDHVIPRSQGGPNTRKNLVACCESCNGKKRNRTPEQAGMRLLAPGTIVLVKGAEHFGDA